MVLINCIANGFHWNIQKIFQQAAAELGYIGSHIQAKLWFDNFIKTDLITPEVENWCLDKLYPPFKTDEQFVSGLGI